MSRLKAKSVKDCDLISKELLKEAQKLMDQMWQDDDGPLDKMSSWCLLVEDMVDAGEKNPKSVNLLNCTCDENLICT